MKSKHIKIYTKNGSKIVKVRVKGINETIRKKSSELGNRYSDDSLNILYYTGFITRSKNKGYQKIYKYRVAKRICRQRRKKNGYKK